MDEVAENEKDRPTVGIKLFPNFIIYNRGMQKADTRFLDVEDTRSPSK